LVNHWLWLDFFSISGVPIYFCPKTTIHSAFYSSKYIDKSLKSCYWVNLHLNLNLNDCPALPSSAFPFLKQQVLRFEFVPVGGVYHVRRIVKDVSKGAEDNERLPAVNVGPRPGKEGVDNGGQGLKHAVVCLQGRYLLLHLDLNLGVRVDVGADLHAVIEVDRAHLVDVEILGDEERETLNDIV
jgi:hypothetical protein